MDQINVFCNEGGHETILITHLCTYMDCQLQSRWCCLECIEDQIHDHEEQDLGHIIPLNELKSFFKQNFRKLQSLQQEHLNELKIMELKSAFTKCEQMKIQTDQYKKELYQLQNNIKDNEIMLKHYLQIINDGDFINQERDLINQIVDIQSDKFVLKDLQLYNNLNNNIQQIIGPKMNTKYKDQKQYFIQKIDSSNQKYQCSQISNDMRYLAYGGDDQDLNIYDIKQNQVIKKIKIPNTIISCQFSSDSQYLYVGTYKLIIVYNVINRFKQIFRLWFNSQSIQRIILLQHQQMIACATMKIIKIDLKSRKKIFVIRRKNEYITALEYNHFDQVIVFGNSSRFLIFWDCRMNSIIIKQRLKYSLQQIQIINSETSILTLDVNGNLEKYQVDLMNKVISKIQFYDFRNICSFYNQQASQGQILLLISKYYLMIIDMNGEVQYKLYHFEYQGGQTESIYQYTFQNDATQLDNLRYVILRSMYSIFLAVAQG